jgi:hypothetical protein
VEDWEQFFEEKSRRRADEDRRTSRGRNIRTSIIAVLVAAAATGALFYIS